MSNILRSTTRVWSRSLKLSTTLSTTPTRAFHSPFAVLGHPQPPAPSIASNPNDLNVYEKQVDYSPEPVHGQKTYVVSEPDPANTPYKVPAGAYPTTLPYINFTATSAPNADGQPMSSTSSTLAHPVLTRAVPQNPSGVGESSAVRHADAPGSMGQRGGGHGGAGLVDAQGTRAGEGSLGERNPPPIDSEVVEKFSRMGVKDAWQARK